MLSRALGPILLVTISLAGCQEPTVSMAEKVFTGGTIYTADSSQSVVSAMAISGDQILATGSDSSMAALIGEHTQVIDLQGKMIIPGLHDVHIHLPGIVESDSCDLASTPYSLEDLVPRLKPCLQGLDAGEWLSVDQWSYTAGNEPSERLPTVRAALDAVSTEHPIMLLGNDGHHGAVNSYALALATDKYGNQVGLSAETLAAEFVDFIATVGVDASGEPNGALNEDARKLVNIPNLWGYPAVDNQLVSRISDKLAANGITSVLDAALTSKDIAGFASAAKDSALTYRMSVAFYADFEDYRPQPDAAIDVDAVVAEGFEAGGHNGKDEITTMCLIPKIADEVNIPVIAAGGIADGRAMLAAMCLGADGVQIGSRFAVCKESSAHENFKNYVFDAKDGATDLTLKEITAVRLLKNDFYQKIQGAYLAKSTTKELKELLGRGRAKKGMFEGNLSEGELEIGQVSSMINKMQTSKEIIDEIIDDFNKVKSHLSTLNT